ncbi:hypothetical protein D3C80_983470 [compost metagenome]
MRLSSAERMDSPRASRADSTPVSVSEMTPTCERTTASASATLLTMMLPASEKVWATAAAWPERRVCASEMRVTISPERSSMALVKASF